MCINWIVEAHLFLVIESGVPWIRMANKTSEDCTVDNSDEDPFIQKEKK